MYEEYEAEMESVEEEELLIDQLFDALNGIERCFESGMYYFYTGNTASVLTIL